MLLDMAFISPRQRLYKPNCSRGQGRSLLTEGGRANEIHMVIRKSQSGILAKRCPSGRWHLAAL
eukprot:8746255-Pyramimonas_sp.AAC.1